MKQKFWIAAMLLITAACGSGEPSQTEHYYWLGNEGEVIIFTRMANVFRGEYIDPDFQERASVPIVGRIDNEGNVNGAGFDIQNGNLYAQISGKITGDTFEANWSPLPQAISEFRSISMKRQKPEPEIEREIEKHHDAFYNWLFPEQQLCTSSSEALNRITPFLSEKPAVADGQLYGYQIGEWEMKRLRIVSVGNDEVHFYIAIEQNGQSWVNVEMEGAAKLSGNTFRYKEKGYEFEVAVYNGFAVITPIEGTSDLNVQEVQITNSEGVIDQTQNFTAAGVYPLLPKGLVDSPFYEINFYCDKSIAGAKE